MKATINGIKKVISNQSMRHFTIIKEDGTKYRTYKLSREEFKSCEFNTLNDWNDFLKSDEYYKVK